MSPNALIWWAVLAAGVVILVMIVMQLLRLLGEVKRLGSRVEAMADLPVVTALRRAESDGARIEAAIAELPALLARGQVAVAAIRRGPFPPEFIAAIRRVGAEIAAFRRFSAR